MSHGVSFALDFSAHWSAYAQHKSILWLVSSLLCEIKAIYLIKNYNCSMWVRLYWPVLAGTYKYVQRTMGYAFVCQFEKQVVLWLHCLWPRLWRRITKKQFFSLENHSGFVQNILNWFWWKSDICIRVWNKIKICIKVLSDPFF